MSRQRASLCRGAELGREALFGEKYGDVVRVVTVPGISVVCGGTHVRNTSEIAFFRVVTKPVWPLECAHRRLTAGKAFEHLRERDQRCDRRASCQRNT